MTHPALTAVEIAAVRAARHMERVEYPGGSVVATSGRHVLFASGAAESFDILWAEALRVRQEITLSAPCLGGASVVPPVFSEAE